MSSPAQLPLDPEPAGSGRQVEPPPDDHPPARRLYDRAEIAAWIAEGLAALEAA